MKPDLPSIDHNERTPRPTREVEYALILSQMIDVAEKDPSQMRLAIYEFARAKLNYNTLATGESEKEQLSIALEAAIAGVEKFSQRRDNKRTHYGHPTAPMMDGLSARGPDPRPLLEAHRSDVPLNSVRPPRKVHWLVDTLPVIAGRTWAWGSTLNWFAITLSLLIVFAGLAFMTQKGSLWRGDPKQQVAAASDATKKAAAAPAATPKVNDQTASTQATPQIPLPSDYGVYALNGASLIELHPLAEQVPDRRVAMSAPVNRAGQMTLPDGNTKFVIFRRDFANNAPDRFEVRSVARIARVITFDPKGKPIYSPAPPSWIIRNVAYEFKVRPVSGNPEMLFVQPKDPDFELPPGRYVLALKDLGYDFSVDGKISDPSQCIEQTDAVNGSFYSDCQSQTGFR